MGSEGVALWLDSGHCRWRALLLESQHYPTQENACYSGGMCKVFKVNESTNMFKVAKCTGVRRSRTT